MEFKAQKCCKLVEELIAEQNNIVEEKNGLTDEQKQALIHVSSLKSDPETQTSKSSKPLKFTKSGNLCANIFSGSWEKRRSLASKKVQDPDWFSQK